MSSAYSNYFSLKVFHISRPWMEGASIGLTAAGALMVALSALIFALSFVFWPKSSSEGNSKESMRNRRFSQVRPASKTPPLVLMCMLYPALPVWMFFVAVSVAFHMCSWILDGVCHTEEVLWSYFQLEENIATFHIRLHRSSPCGTAP